MVKRLLSIHKALYSVSGGEGSVCRARKKAQCLRALAPLAEDLGSGLTSHLVGHKSITPVLEGIQCPLLASMGISHIHAGKRIHKIKIHV